jgi:NADH-quinone oxidoreductase subunit A
MEAALTQPHFVTPVSSDFADADNCFVTLHGSITSAVRMLSDWLPFLIYGFLAFAIPASMIAMSFLFAQRPARRTRARTIPFESGVSRGQMKAQRFTVSFYLTAMLFIVFDIEIVFLYPLAVQLHALGWFGFVEFAFFVLILLVAYVYIWRKGALEW